MIDRNETHSPQILQFGRRRGAPRVCVLDHKPHVRSFLAGMLEEIGFVARESGAAELKTVLAEFDPDLVSAFVGMLREGEAQVNIVTEEQTLTAPVESL